MLTAVLFPGCEDGGNYGINQKQPIASGQEIFHAKFDPLMSNDRHRFIDHIYTYVGIENGKIKVRYDYTEQFMGKTKATTDFFLLSLNSDKEAILDIKPIYPSDPKDARKLVLKIVDDQNRITTKLWRISIK